ERGEGRQHLLAGRQLGDARNHELLPGNDHGRPVDHAEHRRDAEPGTGARPDRCGHARQQYRRESGAVTRRLEQTPTRRFRMSTKEAYVAKAKAQLKEWSAQIDLLVAKAGTASASAKVDYE